MAHVPMYRPDSRLVTFSIDEQLNVQQQLAQRVPAGDFQPTVSSLDRDLHPSSH
jgi:hypothetical protein